MLASTGLGPAADGMGLFNVISTYQGRMSIGFTCCREMMPDPAFYSQCIRDAFEELKSAVLDAEARAELRASKKQNKQAEQAELKQKKPAKKKRASKAKKTTNKNNRPVAAKAQKSAVAEV